MEVKFVPLSGEPSSLAPSWPRYISMPRCFVPGVLGSLGLQGYGGWGGGGGYKLSESLEWAETIDTCTRHIHAAPDPQRSCCQRARGLGMPGKVAVGLRVGP